MQNPVTEPNPAFSAPRQSIAGGPLNLVLAGLVFLLALAVRLPAWRQVFADGTIYWYDPDCYLRLRKIWVLLENFPRPWVHDYFQGFPQGTGVISIPVIEYLVALLAFPFRHLEGLATGLPTLLALLPPVFGGLAALLMFRLLKPWFGVLPALAGAAIVAIMAPQADATALGRFDNEMAELLLLLLTLTAYAPTLAAPERRRPWVLTSLAAFFFLLVWRGAMLPLAVIGLDLLLRLVAARRHPGRATVLGQRGALLYLTMGALAGLVCLSNIWGTGGLFSYNIVSQFHVVLFALAATGFLLLGSLLDPAAGASGRKRLVQFGLAALALLFTGLLARHLVAGASMIGGGNAWIETIVQYQRPDLQTLVHFHGLLFLAAPLSLLLLLRTSTFKDFPARSLVTVLILALFALALFRLRFAIYAALPAALGLAIACRYALSLPSGGTSRGWQIGIALTALLAVLPNLAFLKDMPRPLTARGDLGETLAWLRSATPPAGDPLRPDQMPAYGVLSRWDYSGWIETVGQRPTVATAYGTETYGMEEAARFFVAASEPEMRAVLDRNRVRYLVLDKMAGDLDMYARLIGDSRQFVTRQWDASRQTERILPTPESFALVASRLYFADGRLAQVGPVRFEPVESVRLVFESGSPGNVFGFPWEIRKIKVFEYHAGPELVIRGKPGTVVGLTQPVETNQRRRFDYRAEKMLDATGEARFLLPYAPKTAAGTSGSVGPAVVSAGAFRQEIEFTDGRIAGQTIHIH